MIELLRVLALLILVGASLSGVFTLIFDWSLAKFVIGTIISVILQIAIKWYLDRLEAQKVEQIIEELPMPSIKMQIECAYCKKSNVIDYNLLHDEFECDNCKNVNAIYGKFYAARKNTPLDAAITPDFPEIT